MNQFWKEAIKEFNISERYACPSTKIELQQGQGYRHLYKEVLYRVTALQEELVQLVLSCFGPPTRLRLSGNTWYSDTSLYGMTLLGNLKELSIRFYKDGINVYELNKLLSSTNRLVSLHIEFSELYQCY